MGASASAAADAYNTALAFPNLFRRLFAEGAFAAAFVPAYARKLPADGGPERRPARLRRPGHPGCRDRRPDARLRSWPCRG